MKEVEPTYTAVRGHGLSIIVFTFFVALLFFACEKSQAFDTSLLIAPQEAVQAAQEGLQRYLNTIADWELPYFNFHSRDEFKDATVGKPLRVFFFRHPQDILRADPNKFLIDFVDPLPEWSFPVISRGKYRTILTVAFMKNKWKAVGIGDSGFAKSFAHVMTAWPASRGYRYVFVRDRSIYANFIILIHHQEINVIPLPNLKVWGLKKGKVLDQSEALSLFKKRFNEVKARHKRGLSH